MAVDTMTIIIAGCLIGAVFIIIIAACLMTYCKRNRNINRLSSKSTTSSYSKVSQGNTSHASYDIEINTDSEADLTDIEEGILSKNAKYISSRKSSTSSSGANITGLSQEEMAPMLETDDLIIDNKKKMELSSDINIQTDNIAYKTVTDHAQANNAGNDTVIEMTEQEVSKLEPVSSSSAEQIQGKSPQNTNAAPETLNEQQNGDGSKDNDYVATNNDIHEKHDGHSHGPECHENAAIKSKSTGSIFGESQSPINIMTSISCGKTKLMTDDEFISNPLRFHYPEKVKNCTIMNNGHTVQVNIAKENECTLRINGKSYELKQFHFHTPSEHLIDGETFEMEMHLVHVNELSEIAVLGFIFTTKQQRYKPSLKLSASRMHLILDTDENNDDKQQNPFNPMPSKKIMASKVNIMEPMKEGNNENSHLDDLNEESDDLDTDSEWESDGEHQERKMDTGDNDKTGNDFLAQFWDQLPSKKTEQDIPLRNALSFDYLFETSSTNFKKNVETNAIDIDMELFEYMGSLTTPPYTEGVQWLVSKKTHYINKKQLKRLSGCDGCCGNARPVQDYFGRTVSLRSKSSLKVVS